LAVARRSVAGPGLRKQETAQRTKTDGRGYEASRQRLTTGPGGVVSAALMIFPHALAGIQRSGKRPSDGSYSEKVARDIQSASSPGCWLKPRASRRGPHCSLLSLHLAHCPLSVHRALQQPHISPYYCPGPSRSRFGSIPPAPRLQDFSSRLQLPTARKPSFSSSGFQSHGTCSCLPPTSAGDQSTSEPDYVALLLILNHPSLTTIWVSLPHQVTLYH